MQEQYQYEVVETFMSLEGEGPHSLRPTAYIRFGRCNLKCPGFNNPNKDVDSRGYANNNFDPSDYTSIFDIPLITKGCDSQYSVNPAFSHMWNKMTLDELVDNVISLLPDGKWIHPTTGLTYILSLTGGEPTLLWKFLPDILNHPKMADCRHILIETNCTVPFKPEFVEEIGKWLDGHPDRKWTWSNSPKISSSGELRKASIKPRVAASQYELLKSHPNQAEQYFKFVTRADEEDYAEIDAAMEDFYGAGIPRNTEVWVMPQACTQEQQDEVARRVAEDSITRGWYFSYRIQNALWGNGVGT